jgi:hypothetical protein
MARYDVFLSYSRADTERVAPLRDELRRMGYRVFFDAESIDPGEKWKTRLERAIRASRALVLCWSKNVVGHEFITFEYTHAAALHKPVIPWLLDATPLPQMLEIQGIAAADPAEAAARLKSRLGWPLDRRRKLAAALAILVAILAGAAAWRYLHPPPWTFQGEVTDRVTAVPIVGVSVEVTEKNGEGSAQTDAQGHFAVLLPRPQPAYVNVTFSKDGYEAERPLNVPSDKPWNMDMAKMEPK